MSWTDFYQRRDTIDLVLARARRNPGGGLPFADLTEVRDQFGSCEELALALQYKWSQLLHGTLGVALLDAEKDAGADNLEAVASAWRRAAAEAPVLRELLDGYVEQAGPEFLAALAAEQRMLAYASGLAEFGEPAKETARIGSAFLALIRDTPVPQRRGCNRIEQLIRKVVPST
ncbi:MAG TPA: hypothetical protein VJ914_33260 [Pseudonocardiaceae bacterium]|nr:hypothetical protein [Pseudonocardiaceae bacterium]